MTATRSTTSRPTAASVLAAALCILAILPGAGCGQSGPLFLPTEEPPAPVESASVQEPAAGQDEQGGAGETGKESKNREETP